MSAGAMPKSELPEDISKRLERIISRCMESMREEVLHMIRFANMSEVEAARQVLEEKGEPMKLDHIMEELKGGGIWRPATGAQGSSADAEMKRSISRAAAHGVNLKFVDRENEIIGLP